jgi:Fe-S cluster assembly protein SufD
VAALDRSTLERLNVGASSALAERRQAAFDLFEKIELPSGADETWRYVDLQGDFTTLDLPESPGSTMAVDAYLGAVKDPAGWATMVDGHLVSSTGLAVSGDLRSESMIPTDLDKFAAAHAVFSSSLARVEVAPGKTFSQPVVVDVQATRPGSVSFPRIEVELGDNSEANVVIAYRSLPDIDATIVPHVEIRVGDAARLRLVSMQTAGLGTTVVTQQRAWAGRDASVRIGEVGLGSLFGRVDLGVELGGAGSSTEVVGLYFGHRQQILDYRLVITHRGRNTTSDVFLKGAVEDNAESVFTGLLRIEKDAIRSSAFETNRNLVLSPGAKAHSVPNLEIICNDVVCGHGSSVGPLDDEHLYYLMSRGLQRPRAERLLVRGFFREVLERLPVTGVYDPVAEEINRRFVEAQAEQRV